MRLRPSLALALALGLAAAALAAVALSACGGAVSEPAPSGAQLFRQKCSNCHTLAELGAQGRVGPNLDQLKANEQRVLAAIEKGGASGQLMPKDLFQGKDAKLVAAYVARTTGAPAGGAAPAGGGGGNAQAALGPSGETFKQKCGTCHTLKAAGTTGTSGPNLDDLKPTLQRVLAAIANGGVGGTAMPKKIVTGAQAQDVAKFVSENAGK